MSLDTKELRLECLKLAVPLTSAAEADRVKSVATVANELYSFVVSSTDAVSTVAETSPVKTLHLNRGKK